MVFVYKSTKSETENQPLSAPLCSSDPLPAYFYHTVIGNTRSLIYKNFYSVPCLLLHILFFWFLQQSLLASLVSHQLFDPPLGLRPTAAFTLNYWAASNL